MSQQQRTDHNSIRNPIDTSSDSIRTRSESRGSSSCSRSSSRSSSVIERITSSIRSVLSNGSISSRTAIEDPMQIVVKSYIKDAKKLCKKIQLQADTINAHQKMKVKRYFERLMNTVIGLQVIRPPSSNHNNSSYPKTFHKVLRLLKRTVSTARSVSTRAMMIWSQESLVQYTDALTAVDAILTLIVDSPSIIYDKEIAWDAFLKIICVLFECFPSILDSNAENVTNIKQNGFRLITTFKAAIGSTGSIQAESIKLEKFFN